MRESSVKYGLCAKHRRRSILLVLTAVGVAVSGLGVILLAGHLEKPMWSILGIALFIVAAVIWSFAQVLTPAEQAKGATGYRGAGAIF